jgi:hypothetical protein
MVKLSHIGQPAIRSRSLIAGMVFFATLVNGLPAFAQDSDQRPAAAQSPASEEEPFTGAFSSGVKIELVGLSQHPSQGQPWWTPDGMIMKEPPYMQSATPLRPGPEEKLIEICWRWIGLPPAEIQNAKWEFSPTLKPSQEVVPTGPDGARLADLHAAVVTVSAREDDFTIRFSLPARGATGPNPALETVEFRGGSTVPNRYRRVRLVRISPDGKEERLPAAGVTKALIEQERNSPAAKEREEQVKKERALEQALGEQPAYRLKEGERFKHAPPPFSAVRQAYWVTRSAMPGREPDPTRPGFMLFQWVNGKLDWKSASFDSPTIGRILDRAFNLKRHRIEGGISLLSTELPGDWILSWDPNAAITGDPQASYSATQEDIAAFERIVQEELLEIVGFELREVKRPVYVIRGTYKYTQIPDPNGNMRARRSDAPDDIKLIAGNRSLSGAFPSFPEMLEQIGEFLRIPLVDETTTKTTKRQVQLSIFGPATAEAKPLDQATIDAALASLTTQTGYTFTKEERPVKMLFIKRGIRE